MGEPLTPAPAAVLRIGVVGLGTVSGAYLDTLARMPGLRVTALADLDRQHAEAALPAAPGARVLGVGELLAAPDVDLVLDLTVPAAHAEITARAVAAGKHVYGEKPLALTVEQASEMLRGAGPLRVGCAPDTVLGTGIQTARAVIEAGRIGTPLAANAFFGTAGHEAWHPNPEFYYQPGAGPLFDMGPYYLSALVHLLGPVRRVVATAGRSSAQRVLAAGARAGTAFPVAVDTHVSGLLEHEAGALTTLTMSFDTVRSQQPRLEVHGSAASLEVPDPNRFDGPVRLAGRDGGWAPIEDRAGYRGATRGVGLLDLAAGLAAAVPHRASADLALHVLDVMESLLRSAADGSWAQVTCSCQVPVLVPLTDVSGLCAAAR